MKLIETIAASIIPRSIDPEKAHDPRSTTQSLMSRADHSAYLKGLNKVQETFFMCKYVNDEPSCKKGLSAYRAHIYRNDKLMCWLKACQSPDRMSESFQKLVTERMSISPIMSWLAYQEMVKSKRCETCLGAGSYENTSVKIKCIDCDGSGYLSKEVSAQQRAIYLHVGLSTYWKRFDGVFNDFYKKPLIDVETRTLMKIMENVKGKS